MIPLLINVHRLSTRGDVQIERGDIAARPVRNKSGSTTQVQKR